MKPNFEIGSCLPPLILLLPAPAGPQLIEEARRVRHEAQERAVRDAVASLAREGVYPSAKRVFDRAGLGLGLGTPRLNAVWRDAQKRVGVVLL